MYIYLKLTFSISIIGAVNTVYAKGADDNAKKPNIIYIMADQLRYDALGYAGDEIAKTPNIDKLAAQSINMTNAVTCGPVSSAHRASLFTGKYVSTTGMVINELRINSNHDALAHVLTRNGYETAYIGKWHLYGNCSDHHDPACGFIPKGEFRLGFDGVWKAYNFKHNYMDSYYYEDSPTKIPYGKGSFEPEAQFTQAMDYIEIAANKDNPFALVLSIGVPHDPWTKENVPDKYYNKFSTDQFSLPGNWVDTPDSLMDRNTDKKKWIKYWKQNIPEMKHVYYAMISALDDYLGNITEQLERLGIDDNTIIVFSSDHGEMFGENGRIFKMIFYESSVRVPFLIRYPDKLKPGKSDICINTPDIMPTLLGLCNLEIPEAVEGLDLSDKLITGKGFEPEMAFIQGMGHTFQWKDGHEWRAVRNKQYTYAKYLKTGQELVFDNLNDPLQKNNLADNLEYLKIKKMMNSYMIKKMKEIKDEFKPCSYYKCWVSADRCIIK